MTLRRLLLGALAPPLLLLAVQGGVGLILLDRVATGTAAILRENYDSVLAMVGLNEAVERIDSAFTAALLGDEVTRLAGRAAYDRHWADFERYLREEERNVTIMPREQELVDALGAGSAHYRALGDRFFAAIGPPLHKPPSPAGPASRVNKDLERLYQEELLPAFRSIKNLSQEIRELNQQHMEAASAAARLAADRARLAFLLGLALAVSLALLLAWRAGRAILRPVQELTRSARAIEGGDLDQTVAAPPGDELGDLAAAFNRMTRQLRDYRRSSMDRLLRARRAAQATIDSFPDPVLVVDPQGGVELANPAARALLGVPAEGAENFAKMWVPPEPLAGPVRAALERQQPTVTEAFDQALVFRVGGEDHAYLPRVWPIQDPDGGTLGAALILHDVTRFRLLDQIKTDLVATVSHELKTPLTSVRLVLHLLLEEVVGPLTAKQTELLVDARDNAERLLEMIERLLEMARLEAGRTSRDIQGLDLAPEDPAELLRRAADEARVRAEAERVELSVEAEPGLPPVAADAERLGHALGNLLDNALAVTPPGGRVSLTAGRSPEGGVRLTVSDTGPGVPPEALPHLFEKFYRVPGKEARRPRGGGTGLGLAIVREVVEAHRGTVRCVSEGGRGATFEVTLPAWVGEAARQAGLSRGSE